MSELTFSKNLIKLYTNKNRNIFKEAGKLVEDKINKKIGLIYDDYDYKGKIVEKWKHYNLDTIFIVAPRRKTLSMDDKIFFYKKMKDSSYTPESYLSVDVITDKNSLYFVKLSGSTGGKGVNIYEYNDLLNVNTKNCIIQKSINNPDLYLNRRYKIRQLVLLYKSNVYLHSNSWFSLSNINFDSMSKNTREANVISQKHDTVFEICNKLENFDTIFNNIKLAVTDFKKLYKEEINNIKENEYAVLGFDFIVDSQKNVQIIEINHRSNYAHPVNVKTECDVTFFKDTIMLLINENINDTKFLLI